MWEDEHWQLTAIGPTGLPLVLILEPKEHYDIDTLPAELAAEMGPLLQRIERAIRAVDDIGRVHIGRWGEGSEHLHWWFFGRPARMRQLGDSFAAIWDDVLPPVPEELWRANVEAAAAAMRG
jgi:diadenosine tetraphosphate (Ap4A) HIT family hydrolase